VGAVAHTARTGGEEFGETNAVGAIGSGEVRARCTAPASAGPVARPSPILSPERVISFRKPSGMALFCPKVRSACCDTVEIHPRRTAPRIKLKMMCLTRLPIATVCIAASITGAKRSVSFSICRPGWDRFRDDPGRGIPARTPPAPAQSSDTNISSRSRSRISMCLRPTAIIRCALKSFNVAVTVSRYVPIISASS